MASPTGAGKSWDAIVIGARCAGAATALLLARHGHRVLLVDRGSFPSDTMSTLYIHQPGLSLLRHWGLLDAITASKCPTIDSISYRVEDVLLNGPLPAVDGIKFACAPRRNILDQIMITAAVGAGVEFAEQTTLSTLLSEDERVVGVRLRTKYHSDLTERAKLVVGADGMRSKVAGLLGVPFSTEDPRATCIYYTGWTGLSCGFTMREQPGSWIATVPTHDGVTLVLTYFPRHRFPEIRTGPLESQLAAIRQQAPDLSDELVGADQVMGIRGTGDQPNFFRKAFGSGWVLVGDAGHHLDSITARGITNAFIQAQILSEEIGAKLDDDAQLQSALSRFASRRDEALIDGYVSTLETSKLQVPSSRLEMLRAISGVPAFTEKYFSLMAGMMSMDDFLTPELIELLFG